MAQQRSRGQPRQEKKTTSYRLTTEALDLLSRLAQRYGLNHSDMLEVMIRDKARSEAIWPQHRPNPHQ